MTEFAAIRLSGVNLHLTRNYPRIGNISCLPVKQALS